jgi:Na+/H+ antiporter NhaD/arsenite permease-like protein
MTIAILIVFVLGYAAIVLEHSLKVNKAAVALLTGVLCWVLYSLGHVQGAGATEAALLHHMEDISGILLFLMGAMTVVEVLDSHESFRVITDRIHTTNKVKLMWIIGLFAFFLSAVLDNLTTTIVMVSLARKLISDQKTRWFYAGIIIIASNAGGAWSPIGDVTTTMLWIGNQVTTLPLIKELLACSLINLLIPMIVLSFVLKGNLERPAAETEMSYSISNTERNIVFFVGLGGLLFVPIFKNVTHLPPFMGMMLSLGVIWIVTEIMHGRKVSEAKSKFSAYGALQKIDMPSVLFFLGILLAVAALSEAGHLFAMASWLKNELGNIYSINIAIGLLSAVVDNVPLVAGSIGMYDISPAITGDAWADMFVQDGPFWHFLAYTAGTGGSILIIGSAAGVAAMGIENIPFMWYLKKIGPWALLGYLAGAALYITMH